MKRILLRLALVLPLLALSGVLFLARPPAARSATDRRIEPTPERLERGRHLAENVLGCATCHSQVDWTRYGRALQPATVGGGGHCLGRDEGFPGHICAPNITPDPIAGVGSWTDDELLRALREGVSRDGTALFPMMPWDSFRQLPDEEVEAVVVWMRSLEPLSSTVSATEVDLPLRWIARRLPEPLEEVIPPVDRSDEVSWGRHLAKVAHCEFCHTPIDSRNAPVEGMAFAGGHEFTMEGHGSRFSANLTPHSTGLGGMSREAFIDRFRTFGAAAPVDPVRNTPMPWESFAGMSDDELGAIWAYLQVVEPVEHRVQTGG